MARPAAEIRANAQQIWNGAAVVGRGRNWIRHQHPTQPGRYMLDSVMGPLHIAGTSTEIDTAWTVGDSAPYRRRMILADYHALAGLDNAINFDAGQIVRYVHPASGRGVAFQPQSLDWTNDLNQIQPISQPLQVGATVNDDTLTWTGAYGTGLDFHWQTQTARLQKRLVVNALSNLPTPNATILSGGNPVLRLPFIFQPDSGVDIYVNGVLWNRNANNPQTTTSNIEFRLAATGETLWYFTSPFAFDNNSPNPLPVVSQRIRRSGNSLFVEIRVPWSWLQTAVYPVTIDPTIDPTTGTDTDDGKTGPSADYSNNGGVWSGNYYGAWNAWQRFPSVSGLSGVTIDVSYITTPAGGKVGSPATRIYAERAAAPTYPTSTSDYNGRTLTTAYTTHGGSDAHSPTPSLNSVLQELVDDFDPTAIQIFHKDNGSASNENYYSWGNHPWTGAKTLHIEYTAGGANQTVSCSAGALGLGEHAASVIPGAVNIACATGALALGESGASVVPGAVNIACATGALALGESGASVVPGSVNIACATGALALGESGASVVPGAVNIACATGALGLDEQAATLENNFAVVCVVAALDLSGQAVQVTPGGVSVACATGALALGESGASVVPGAVTVACAVSALDCAGEPAQVQSGGVLVACAAGALALGESGASVVPGSVNVACAVGALALDESGASVVPGSVNVACATGALSVAGQAVSISSSDDQLVVCTTLALNVQGLSISIQTVTLLIGVDAPVKDFVLRSGLSLAVDVQGRANAVSAAYGFDAQSVTLISVEAEES